MFRTCKLSSNIIRTVRQHPQLIRECATQSSSSSYLAEITYKNFDYDSQPVLSKEIIEVFNPQDGQTYLDMTFGDGGHTIKLLETKKDITLLTMDRDPHAYFKSVEIAKHDSRVFPMVGKFSDMKELFAKNKIEFNSLDGVIVDLGPSNMQLNDKKRGFRLTSESLLDMRMDGNRCNDSVTASDVLNLVDYEGLEKIFRHYGMEKLSKKYADAIIDSRALLKEVRSTTELAFLISSINTEGKVTKESWQDNHSASKIFLALRMFVNNELNELNYLLEQLPVYMKRDDRLVNDVEEMEEKIILNQMDQYNVGKLCIVSCHEQEDKIIKDHFNNLIDKSVEVSNFLKYRAHSFVSADLEKALKKIRNRRYLPLRRGNVKPSKEEKKNIVRAASAKLRSAARIE